MLSSFYYEKGGISLQNQFILNVDLKRNYCSDKIAFRRGDTVIILFNFFDDGEELSLNSATKAMIHQKTSKGNIIETECTFTTYSGKRVVKFEVEDIAMVEIGYLNLLLTVWQDRDVVSIQPFNVYVYDDYMGGAGSFIELIQELQRQIENMVLDMNNAIKLTEKGVPNGVATLDNTGKIPLAQLPSEIDAYLKHTTETIYKHQSHGLRINNDDILEYESSPNTWTEVGFAERQGGGSQTLEATISIVDGIATITYTGIPTVASSKWATGAKETSYFILSGTSFTGVKFNVSSLGMHTLYYKDSNGVEYSKQFNVEASMMNKPSIPIDVEDGFVTITPPTSPTISIKKWTKGSQGISYFAYLGTTFTGNTFEVTEIGTYTIYVKTSSGLEYVYEFDVTEDMLPSKIPQYIYHVNRSFGYSGLDRKYRSLAVSVDTENKGTRIQFSGQDLSISANTSSVGAFRVDDEIEGKSYFETPYFNYNSTNTTINMDVLNNDGVKTDNIILKTTSQYDYLIVNNTYISLFEIKGASGTFTIPETIEGLPVIDVGCVFNDFWNYTGEGKTYNVSTLILPERVQVAGSWLNNNIKFTTLRVNNPNFKWYPQFAGGGMKYNNTTDKLTIYTPTGSEFYNNMVKDGHTVIGI